MSSLRITFTGIVLVVALLATAAVVDAAAMSHRAGAAATATLTPAGVGKVKLGESYAQLRAKHLVGTIHKGCELAGPQARAANLKAPLKGGVDFTLTSPRKL